METHQDQLNRKREEIGEDKFPMILQLLQGSDGIAEVVLDEEERESFRAWREKGNYPHRFTLMPSQLGTAVHIEDLDSGSKLEFNGNP